MKIGFIGGGEIAEAMTAGIISSGLSRPLEIVVSDSNPIRRSVLKRKFGVVTAASNLKTVRESSLLVLAVRPQDQEQVLVEIAPHVKRSHLVVTIAAGIPISFVRQHLPNARIVRVMPNMPCQVSAAISAFTMGPGTTAMNRHTICRFLSSFGEALELPENKFHAVTALSGSGPGFLAYFLREMVRGGVMAGLTEKEARCLASYTMHGTGKLLAERDISLDDLIDRVASSKGTTAAGLDVLEKSTTRRAIRNTIVAAAKRSRELSRRRR